MSKRSLDGLAVGDIVQVRNTREVTVSSDRHVRLTDKRSGESIWLNRQSYAAGGYGSTRVDMVKRAAKPRPQQGDLIKGRDVRDRMWKRGTIIRCIQAADSSGLVLTADAQWKSLDDPKFVVEFDDLAPNAEFRVLHIA